MFIALATGYKAPVIKASMTGNERQEDLTGGTRVLRNGRKRPVAIKRSSPLNGCLGLELTDSYWLINIT